MAGRPKYKITTKVCREAEEYAAQGLTLKQIANNLGIHRDTLNEKKKENSDFSDSVARGRDRGIAEVTNALYKGAIDGDISAIKYFLNNRDPENWKNMQHTELSGSVGLHEACLDELA
jgi:hypothetical protein